MYVSFIISGGAGIQAIMFSFAAWGELNAVVPVSLCSSLDALFPCRWSWTGFLILTEWLQFPDLCSVTARSLTATLETEKHVKAWKPGTLVQNMVQSVFQWVTVFRGFDPTRWEFHWHGYTKELRTGHLQSNLNISVFLNKLAYLWKCQKWNYFCSALGNSAVFPAYCYFISLLSPPKRLRNHTAFFRKKIV